MTLSEITEACRTGKALTESPSSHTLRLAICAYDVLLSKLHVELTPAYLAEYFKAAESKPTEYIGWNNNPGNPEFLEWYAAMKGVSNDK